MKKIWMSMVAALCCMTLIAAPAPSNNLALAIVVEDMVEPFPPAAEKQLQNKLNQLLTKNGVMSCDWQNQFIITAVAVPQTKDILPGPPTKIAETMDMTFYIADTYNKLAFATTTVQTKGVGDNEVQSYMDALKRVNVNTKELSAFIQEGKSKIITYYNTQAPTIISKAKNLAKQNQYENALWMLATIPAECDAFDEAQSVGIEVYQEYQKYVCTQNLAKARAAWAAAQNAEGAREAGKYLELITPDQGCYEDAMALYSEIKGKVLDDWKFEMKQYQDQVDIQKLQVDAWRQVGVAYGQHQQPTTTNIGFLR